MLLWSGEIVTCPTECKNSSTTKVLLDLYDRFLIMELAL